MLVALAEFMYGKEAETISLFIKNRKKQKDLKRA